MISRIGWFLLGIGAGVALGFALFSMRSTTAARIAAAEQDAAVFSNRVAELESALDASQARFEHSERINHDLTARIQDLSRSSTKKPPAAASAEMAAAKGAAAMFGGNGTNNAMVDMMKFAVQQQ